MQMTFIIEEKKVKEKKVKSSVKTQLVFSFRGTDFQ